MTVSAGRNAWMQSDFVMADCGRVSAHQAFVYKRAMLVSYRSVGQAGSERISLPVARIILTR